MDRRTIIARRNDLATELADHIVVKLHEFAEETGTGVVAVVVKLKDLTVLGDPYRKSTVDEVLIDLDL